ncbi:MAG: hypothetical protein KDA42_16530 [Planctomycetales bacterium]|nr:hypothetical protein [Planctomycetales bacterium]
MVTANVSQLDWTQAWEESLDDEPLRRDGMVRELTSRERFTTQRRHRRQKSQVAGPKRRLRKG